MGNCKYLKKEVIDNIEHEVCMKETIKKQNKAEEKKIKCIGCKCGQYEEDGEKKCEVGR